MNRSTHQPATRGLARLEFALVVIVTSVVVAFALDRLAQVKHASGEAQKAFAQTQARASAAMAQVRCASVASTSLAPPPANEFPTDLQVPTSPLQATPPPCQRPPPSPGDTP